MERETNSDFIEKLAEATEETNRLLGQLGLYNASQDEYATTEHNDERWIPDSIRLGED